MIAVPSNAGYSLLVMTREYYVVDAFTSDRFSGNPAAVVLDARGLTDADMASIAAEFNLSETTFVLPSTDSVDSGKVRFRWFTPTVEVDLCGHATIAGALALAASGRFREYGLADPSVGAAAWPIETRSGVLTAYVEPIPSEPEGNMLWLDLPDPVLSPARLSVAELSIALGLDEGAFDPKIKPDMTQDGDLLVFVRDVQSLNESKPDFGVLGKWCEKNRVRGVSLATVQTLTPSVHVQSRFFAPACGINEDPVTGSVHGPLAAKVVALGIGLPGEDVTVLNCTQGVAGGRTGMIHALVQRQDNRGASNAAADAGYAVRIGGRVVVTMRGTLET